MKNFFRVSGEGARDGWRLQQCSKAGAFFPLLFSVEKTGEPCKIGRTPDAVHIVPHPTAEFNLFAKVTKIADTAIGIIVDYRRKMDALSQAREAVASKTRKEKVETLTTAMCEMAKAGVPTEAMTEFVRSERGTQPKEDKHTLSKIILEALKALSAFLKILR